MCSTYKRKKTHPGYAQRVFLKNTDRKKNRIKIYYRYNKRKSYLNKDMNLYSDSKYHVPRKIHVQWYTQRYILTECIAILCPLPFFALFYFAPCTNQFYEKLLQIKT